ncbi:MAG: translation initiation factor IF-2 N-terminal domain-containing protein [Gammaproteobacteria bacterium]|nr:translation initiation factor IF-2 N-terminal domain-containing protein [Gammaproteobacteria bacterium]
MADVSVAQLAKVVGIGADELLTHLRSAGIAADSVEHKLNDAERQKLLQHLQHSKTSSTEKAPSTITLHRKSPSQVMADCGSR